MRFLSVLTLASAFCHLCWAQATMGKPVPNSKVYILQPMNRDFSMSSEFTQLYHMIDEHLGFLSPNNLDKRDALLDNIENLLLAFNRSGLLLQLIDQISNSPQDMDTIANYLLTVMASTLEGSNSSSSFNTSALSSPEAKNLTSEILDSAVQELIYDDLQLIQLANSIGSLLVNQSWIAGIVNFMGVHGWISIPKIFDLAQNYTSKDPNFNGTRYSIVKRDNSTSSYSGSFQSFLNNLISSASQSELVSVSTISVLQGVSDSGITPSVLQQLLGDGNFFNMIGYISTKLYDYGALDAIDLESIVKDQRSSGKLASSLNYALGDPIFSPRIARIFYQLKNNGAFAQLRYNFLGKN